MTFKEVPDSSDEDDKEVNALFDDETDVDSPPAGFEIDAEALRGIIAEEGTIIRKAAPAGKLQPRLSLCGSLIWLSSVFRWW